MIIPEKLRYMGLEWEIKRDKNVAHEGNCYGSTHHGTQTIFLDPTNTILHNEQVLMHEILHAIFWQSGLGKAPAFKGKEGFDFEEQIIASLSTGLYHILKDNDLLK